MGKVYIIKYLRNTLYHVDEFERRDQQGHKIYSRMIIKNFYYIPGTGKTVALIVRRRKYSVNHYCGSTTFSKLKDSFDFRLYLEEMLTDEVRTMLFKEKVYYFDEDKLFCFKAQCSEDRTGFYKQMCGGMLLSEKNYGECTYNYEIIGLKYYERS